MVAEQKQVKMTLTELSSVQKRLTEELETHTHSRNFIWSLLNGEARTAKLSLNHCVRTGEPVPPITSSVAIDLTAMPKEVVEMLLVTLLDHEERSTFMTWKNLASNAAQACKTIEQLQVARTAALKNQRESPEFPATIPMPQTAPADGKLGDPDEST